MTTELGSVIRVALVFTDDEYTLETPTAVGIDVYAPADPDTIATTYDQDDAEVTLGKVFPEPVRTRLARRLNEKAGASLFTAASLAAGAGCVELLYTPAAAGTYRFDGNATSPTTMSTQSTEFVRQTT